jgi:PadR family transcriptional regulator PadR
VDRTPPELLQGTVDILILRALAGGPRHGYAIAQWIDERSEGVLTVDGAGLYQALHRLAHRKWLASSWGRSENNRRARFYELTAAGRSHLRAETVVWRRYLKAVSAVLSPA